jgi:hypothetical protein
MGVHLRTEEFLLEFGKLFVRFQPALANEKQQGEHRQEHKSGPANQGQSILADLKTLKLVLLREQLDLIIFLPCLVFVLQIKNLSSPLKIINAVINLV